MEIWHDWDTVRKALLQARVKKGLSQTRLAQQVGLTRAAIANYEQGRREPDLSTIKAIANALGLDSEISVTKNSKTYQFHPEEMGDQVGTNKNVSLLPSILEKALQTLTETVKQQAEATRIQAEASKEIAIALRIREENEKTRLEKAGSETEAQKSIQKIVDALVPHRADRPDEEAVSNDG